MWRLFQCLLPILLLMGCASTPGISQRRYESLPEGVKLTYQAVSPSGLKQQLKPQISWVDTGNALSVFVWYREENGNPVFVLDCAYPLIAKGKKIWGVLDAHSDDGLEYGHPIREFMQLKYARREMRLNDSHSDADRGFIKLISIGPDGDKIYEMVYNSLSGHRGQEDTTACLVLVSKGGEAKLLTKDFFIGDGKNGWIAWGSNLDFKVEWITTSQKPMCKISLIEEEWYSPGVDGLDIPDLGIFRKGVFTGQLPLKKVMEPQYYVKSDGEMTINSLKDIFIKYFSDWRDSDWATPNQRELVTSLWIDELCRLNPKYSLNEKIPKGRVVFVPEANQYNRTIFDQVLKLEPKAQRKSR